MNGLKKESYHTDECENFLGSQGSSTFALLERGSLPLEDHDKGFREKISPDSHVMESEDMHSPNPGIIEYH